jgi:hypothetical protein
MRIVYVGETANERARLASYGRDGSHLSDVIWWHLKQGWHLHYRATAMASKDDALAMQNRLLAGYAYDWNLLGA